MAGKIVADQLEHSTAGSLDTQFVVKGSSKAYATIDAYQTTTGTTTSFNISSTTDDGAGLWDCSFTNSMSAATYSAAIVGTGGQDTEQLLRIPHVRAGVHTNSSPSEMLTSKCGFVYRYLTSSGTIGNYGYAYSSFTIHGDLA